MLEKNVANLIGISRKMERLFSVMVIALPLYIEYVWIGGVPTASCLHTRKSTKEKGRV